MKIMNRFLWILIFAGMLVISVAGVSADQSVDIGGNAFTIPSEAQNIQTSGDTCNFSMDNVSASIFKIKPNEVDNYIHSNRSRKYEIIKLKDVDPNYCRYDDRLHNERGILAPIQKK